MSKINILSSKIYNRISAGEVVERPSSVVKELVENSIDSGANSIVVEIIDGGITSIKVIDDGSGIEKSQIKNAILPHATSKIATIDDLYNIKSLGFRGEALASIVSVSKFTIVSRTEDCELGVKLYSEGGEDVSVVEIGADKGTEVVVDNLFFNTPAREKFLKSSRSEEGDITALVLRLILSNPNIAFKYVADGKIVYQSFGDGLESAFVAVYGLNVLRECIPIDAEKNGIKISGFIGKHHFVKSNRSHQSIFLNGRYIVNQTISSAIGNAYASYLMKRQYPFYVLNIEVPTETVDVNVHPNKLDVRFLNNQIIYSAVYGVVSKVLDGSSEVVNIVSETAIEKSQLRASEIDKEYGTHNRQKALKNEGYTFDKLNFCDSKGAAKSLEYDEQKFDDNKVVDIFAENKAYIEKLEKEKVLAKESLGQEEIKIDKPLNYVGQALNTFLIFDDGDDLIIIDQHAAHERIMFDRLKNSFISKEMVVQPLIIPFILDVDAVEYEFIVSKLDFFKDLGFDIEEFGINTLKISSVPLILESLNIDRFFSLVFSDLNLLKSLDITDILFDKIAQKACKSAIKAGDKLTEEETKAILTEIKSNFGLKCPHGRPIAVKVSRLEIDKWFKRIVWWVNYL